MCIVTTSMHAWYNVYHNYYNKDSEYDTSDCGQRVHDIIFKHKDGLNFHPSYPASMHKESVCLSVVCCLLSVMTTKIARSRHLGIRAKANHKHNE